jgi:hypothetical protein
MLISFLVYLLLILMIAVMGDKCWSVLVHDEMRELCATSEIGDASERSDERMKKRACE